MTFTLVITINSVTVHESIVTRRSDAWDAMRAHPPTSARGGVVQLLDGHLRETVALSRHSINGPVWGLL